MKNKIQKPWSLAVGVGVIVFLGTVLCFHSFVLQSLYHQVTNPKVSQPQPEPHISQANVMELLETCKVEEIIFQSPDSADALLLLRDGSRAVVSEGSEPAFKAVVSDNEGVCGSVIVRRLPYIQI